MHTVDEVKGYIDGVLSVVEGDSVPKKILEKIRTMLDQIPVSPGVVYREVVAPRWYYWTTSGLVSTVDKSNIPSGVVVYESSSQAYATQARADVALLTSISSEGQTG